MRAFAMLGLVLLGACGSSEPTQPKPDPNALSLTNSRVTVSRPLLLAGDTLTVTLEARSVAGQPVTGTGLTVVFAAAGGTSVGTLQPVIDHHNGTFTAVFAGTTMGTALTIATRINDSTVMSPAPTIRIVGFTRIAVGGATLVGAQTTTGGHTCGVIITGDMYCWGISWFGIRGNGTAGDMSPGPTPTLVAGGHPWSEVAASLDDICALASGGTASVGATETLASSAMDSRAIRRTSPLPTRCPAAAGIASSRRHMPTAPAASP